MRQARNHSFHLIFDYPTIYYHLPCLLIKLSKIFGDYDFLTMQVDVIVPRNNSISCLSKLDLSLRVFTGSVRA